MPEILGRGDAAGEGTGSRFFGGGRIVAPRRMFAGHIIHLIAIGKRKPWLDDGHRSTSPAGDHAAPPSERQVA
jgi:hypothetical protein